MQGSALFQYAWLPFLLDPDTPEGGETIDSYMSRKVLGISIEMAAFSLENGAKKVVISIEIRSKARPALPVHHC